MPWRKSVTAKAKYDSELSNSVERARCKSRYPFERRVRARESIPARIIAYDLETTRIDVGTPRVLYVTAYSDFFDLATTVKDQKHFERILISKFLLDEHRGCKFVAWNGNRFDGYLVAIALLKNKEYLIRPYLTRNNALRGLRIQRVGDSEKQKGWEFLCGIAMLGLEGVSLEKFLINFAPDYKKLTGIIDFDNEDFDCDNKLHREYAMRDSVGLWHGMAKAQSIMIETFDAPLGVTMGGVCIKIFQSHIPRDIRIEPLSSDCEAIFRSHIMRGGFCHCARRYKGPIWKYDINQAYASVMRSSPMPCGSLIYNPRGLWDWAKIYVAEIEAFHQTNIVPFYYRKVLGSKVVSSYTDNHIERTWLTSVEIEQLKLEGWEIRYFQSYIWSDSFVMTEYVDKLELLRSSCEGGPGGAIGTMVKATGNHSYGKMVEESTDCEFLIAELPPTDEWSPYFGDEDEPIQHVWYRFVFNARDKDYHVVQIGAFITSAVRMIVRRAALISPESWLYADTDCVMFDCDVTSSLEIHKSRYGAWKVEESGTPYLVIAKKVYAEITTDIKPKKRSAKGLNVKRLTSPDFEHWFNGKEPVQHQIQRNNFLSVSQTAPMFRAQTRRGTKVERG